MCVHSEKKVFKVKNVFLERNKGVFQNKVWSEWKKVYLEWKEVCSEWKKGVFQKKVHSEKKVYSE